jgi:hypothetical protein
LEISRSGSQTSLSVKTMTSPYAGSSRGGRTRVFREAVIGRPHLFDKRAKVFCGSIVHYHNLEVVILLPPHRLEGFS